jgi:TonB-linked SusC/RagA family outer membrane protein
MRTHHLQLLFRLLVMLFIVSLAQAQTGGITGRIVDDQSNTGLPGANVFLERTPHGASTDVSGRYVITGVSPGAYMLVCRYVGYVSVRESVTVRAGDPQVRDIRLKPSAVQLNPVVVTAIGTQANREELGTSVSTIDGAALETKGVHDLVSSIAALAPGVYTTETTSDPGAATRIVLRGQRSFINDNQPLIVIDGIPVDNSVSVGGGNISGEGADGTAAVSRISDINTDDIQSMEIYSGPSAASLWGSRAANGVIAISTKTGGRAGTKKLSLTVRSKAYYDEVLHLTPLQTSFGQGYGGQFVFNSSSSWGDPIFLRSGGADVLERSNYPYAAIVQKNSKQTYDHGEELFHTPLTWDYGATLRGGDEWGDFYLDLSHLSQNGVVRSNSNFDRTSIRGSTTRRFLQNVIGRFSASYVSSKTDRIQQGSNISGLLLGAYRTSPDFNNAPYLVDYVDPDGNVTVAMQRTYRNGEGDPSRSAGYNNPLYTIDRVPTTLTTDRLFGNTEFTYEPTPSLNFIYRLGVDYYTDHLKNTNPPGDASYPEGELIRAANTTFLLSTDLIGKYSRTITDDVQGSLMIGAHLDHNRYEGMSVLATSFIISNAPATFSNALNFSPSEYLTITRSAALYGQLDVSLFRQVFVKLTGREESASTYGPQAAQTYFYPSASIAWQFTQLAVLQNHPILSFGKLRAAYGEAANRPPPYVTQTYYLINPGFYNSWGDALSGQYYNGAAVRSDQLGNSNLKPEMTAEIEFGADLRFLEDRASLSISRYYSKTTDAILGVNVAPSSGYVSKYANAAKIENRGWEVQLIADWLHLGPFSWATTVNWSQNRNMVTDLSGVESVYLNGFTDPSSRAIVNQPYGVLYGSVWDRKADGSLNVDANGFPQLSPLPGVFGDPNPLYRMGILNTFRYDRLSLSVLLDIKHGGDVWNGTKGALCYFGTDGSQGWWTTISASDAAALRNYDGLTLSEVAANGSKAVLHNADGSYSFRGYVKDFGGGRVLIDESYFQNGPGSGFTGPAEAFVEKAGYVRLREITLSYTFPLEFAGLQSATVSVTGRNLKVWTDYTGNDPETNLTGPSNGQGLDYFNNPTTRSWIFCIQLSY